MAVAGGPSAPFRAEINVSEFLGTLKKLESDKVTERKVPFAITSCWHTSSRTGVHDSSYKTISIQNYTAYYEEKRA